MSMAVRPGPVLYNLTAPEKETDGTTIRDRKHPTQPEGELRPLWGSGSPRRRHAATDIRTQARTPETLERLGRLRKQLARIRPAPSGQEEARKEIINAMARAGLAGWTVPELTDDGSAFRYPDGSVRVTLLSHAIIFNPWGAFRIVDLHDSVTATYFQMSGRDERAFVRPSDGC